MLWVTRHTIRVNRTATAWLVRRFVDPEATFCFVEPGDVARIQRDHAAIGFDAPGARYPHKDAGGRCSFEALVDEYQPLDPALRALARIVHAADFPGEAALAPEAGPLPPTGRFETISLTPRRFMARSLESVRVVPEAAGLRVISQGFPLIAGGDQETLDRSSFLYDALYASLQTALAPLTSTTLAS